MRTAYEPDTSLPAEVRDSIPGRVAKGAALLDEERPGWETRIDLTRLNIRECFNSILGQVFGYYFDGLVFLEIDVVVGAPSSAGVPYGFCPGDHEPWQVLVESIALAWEWADLVKRRRDAREAETVGAYQGNGGRLS